MNQEVSYRILIAGFNLANEKRYDAWGAMRSGGSSGDHVVNPNTGYCANIGHKFDGESGLLYMRARYYEPTTGRFISEDPARDGGNWYAYCGNIPVFCSDPTGEIPLVDILGAQREYIRAQVQEIADKLGKEASMVASLLASLEKYAERYSEVLGEDFDKVFNAGNRVWITGVNRGEGYQIAIDVAGNIIKSYGNGTGTKEGLPAGVPHWFFGGL